jgi:hypothetical protein
MWPEDGPQEDGRDWEELDLADDVNIVVPASQVRIVKKRIGDAIATLRDRYVVPVDVNKLGVYGVCSPGMSDKVTPFLIRGLANRHGMSVVDVKRSEDGGVVVVDLMMQSVEETPIKAPFIVWLAQEPQTVKCRCAFVPER